MAMFYSLVDIISVNAYTCCKLRNVQSEFAKNRSEFLLHLGCQLIVPYLVQRSSPTIPNYTLNSINLVINIYNQSSSTKMTPFARSEITKRKADDNDDDLIHSKKQKGVCFKCENDLIEQKKYKALNKKTRFERTCSKCNHFVCSNHSSLVVYCLDCKSDSINPITNN